MKIKTKFAISNIIMLVTPIICIGVISAFCVVLFILKFPVEKMNISRSALIDPKVFTDAIGVWLHDNPSAIWYIIVWFLICLVVLVTVITIMTQYLSKSIYDPIIQLNRSANEIRNGNLNFGIVGSEYDEIDKLCESFDKMRLSLKRAGYEAELANKEKNMLIANISHDLKTPITAIKGYVEGVNDGLCDTPEKLKLYLDTITKKTDMILDMVNNLSQYSKLELGKLEFYFSKIDLNAFVLEFIEDFSLDLEKNNMSTTLDISKTPITVRADREKLSRVLLNLITNSLKYKGSDTGKIKVRTYISGKNAYIEISDNGIGMSDDEAKKVFESFYRSDSSRNLNTGGSGLGLGIAKQIIERHGGRIWICPNKIGITNIICLPVWEENNG
ncbi:MAG: HAMP domain-containing histidine kinase [Clostridia bacterium]|nr:HAMP domain-containing histidine kinase [Clostridia bacterium]